MKRGYYIGLDTHSAFTELAVMTEAGKIVKRDRCATTIAEICERLRTVPRPRFATLEEGPLAGWLYRNLREDVDELIVCEPRRNRLIAEDGDKDDPVDAAKLADLLRGGYVKAVHQADTLERAVFKQHVAVYHGRVRHRGRDRPRRSRRCRVGRGFDSVRGGRGQDRRQAAQHPGLRLRG